MLARGEIISGREKEKEDSINIFITSFGAEILELQEYRLSSTTKLKHHS